MQLDLQKYAKYVFWAFVSICIMTICMSKIPYSTVHLQMMQPPFHSHSEQDQKNFTNEKQLFQRLLMNSTRDDVNQTPNVYFYKKLQYLPNYKSPCAKSTASKLTCLPYFFLAGMPKCGTTDLYSNIVKHPEIDEIVRKEPHWWTRRRFLQLPKKYKKKKLETKTYGKLIIDSLYKYVKRYSRHAIKNIERAVINGYHHHIYGDGSASTFWDNRMLVDYKNNSIPYTIADVIHYTLPDVKIIVILRNPIDRLYSDYLYFNKFTKNSAEEFHYRVNSSLSVMKRCLKEHNSLLCVSNKDYHDGVRLHIGMYVVFVKDWLRLLDRSQLLVLRLEDYTRDRAKYLQQVAQFLSLEPYPPDILETVNYIGRMNARRTKDKSVGDMWPETRHLLYEFYQPLNYELSDVLKDNRFTWEDAEWL